MLKLIFNILIIAALIVIQTSFFSVLPFLRHLHPVLLYIIYLSIKKDAFLPSAILGGYILDLYSSYPFGLHIMAIVLAATFANYTYFNIITSRRFFTMIILAAASILAYHATISLGMTIMSFLKLSSKTNALLSFDIRSIGIEIIFISITASVVYFMYYNIKKKLSLQFLLKNYAPR